MRKKICIISTHPAPYRDPALSVFFRDCGGRYDITFLQLNPSDRGHPYQERGAYPYPYAVLGEKKLLGWLPFHPEIRGILRTGRYDAVLVPGYSHATCLYVLLYCIGKRVPLIFSGDLVDFERRRGPKGLLRRLWLRFLFDHMASAWVPGNESRQFFRTYGVPAEKIFEGAYCLDTEHLLELEKNRLFDRTGLRRSLGIGCDDFVFLFAGRMIAIRGLDTLIKAYGQVRRSCPGARLLLIGEGEEKQRIIRYITDEKISGVIFQPPVPISDIGAYYRLCDCYVLASTSETYSLALAHAGVLGLPMIATDHVGAAADCLVDSRNGYLVRAGDAQDLAQAMKRMIDGGGNADMKVCSSALAASRS